MPYRGGLNHQNIYNGLNLFKAIANECLQFDFQREIVIILACVVSWICRLSNVSLKMLRLYTVAQGFRNPEAFCNCSEILLDSPAYFSFYYT